MRVGYHPGRSLNVAIAAGQFGGLFNWLRENVHGVGARREDRLEFGRHVLPRRNALRPRGEHGIGGDDTQLALARERVGDG